MNLALPFISFSDPIEPPKMKVNFFPLLRSSCLTYFTQFKAANYTLWDRFEIQGDVTLQELLDQLQVKAMIIFSSECLEVINLLCRRSTVSM